MSTFLCCTWFWTSRSRFSCIWWWRTRCTLSCTRCPSPWRTLPGTNQEFGQSLGFYSEVATLVGSYFKSLWSLFYTLQQPPDSPLKRAVGLVGVVALLLAAIPNLGHVEGLLGVLALEVVLAFAKLSSFLSLYLSVLNINVKSHNMLL